MEKQFRFFQIWNKLPPKNLRSGTTVGFLISGLKKGCFYLLFYLFIITRKAPPAPQKSIYNCLQRFSSTLNDESADLNMIVRSAILRMRKLVIDTLIRATRQQIFLREAWYSCFSALSVCYSLSVCHTKSRRSELERSWSHAAFSKSRPPTSSTHAPNSYTRHTHLLSSQGSQQAGRQSPQQPANQSPLCSLDQSGLPPLADSEADSEACFGRDALDCFVAELDVPYSGHGCFISLMLHQVTGFIS